MHSKKFYYYGLFLIILSSFFLSSYALSNQADENGVYERTDINIFKDTPAWKLAKAVKSENAFTIRRIATSNPELLNYQDSNYGNTPLIWATGMEKYKAAKALLECGANPNITSKRYKTYGEETALSIAAGFSWVDFTAKKDPKYVKLLLKYGADPNWTYIGADDGKLPGKSILMESIGCGIEKTKALVEGGADINYKTKNGETAAREALLAGISSTEEGLIYAHYLIFEKKAAVSEPYLRGTQFKVGDPNEKFYPVDLLKEWVFYLKSEEYKIKKDIIMEFERQGVDYWNSTVDEDTLEEIKLLYPDTWEDYLKKY